MHYNWRRLEADMAMATDDNNSAGSSFIAKMGRNWLVILSLTLLALLAVLEKGSPWLVGGAWILALVALLLRDKPPRPEIPQMQPPVVVEAEDALPESFSSFKAGLGMLDSPIFILDKSAAILFENEAAEKIFGQLTTGTHISARLRSPSILDMIRETIMTGEPNQIEHSERLPSEQVFIVRIAPADLPKSQGKRYYILSFRDISELRRIDRMRSDFVANASHELRTPLASLRGFIETMLGPAKNDPAAQTRFLGIMLDQATRMSRLVDDLMSLSRLELRAHIAPDQKVDLVPLLGHVRDALLPLANELDVSINLHVPEGAVEVQGERDELVQVFQNLVENACKYGQEGKVVDIWLKAQSGKPVEVSVADKGPGIPKEHLPRLTERFYRVSVTDSRSKKGTGLGLAIVKHILTRHRARLIVKSELGEGTEFTVRF
jgi:two-component system, OmpR family, phosphate regulon sensor histidine kinase PhoR